jgi:hypothetical protein
MIKSFSLCIVLAIFLLPLGLHANNLPENYVFEGEYIKLRGNQLQTSELKNLDSLKEKLPNLSYNTNEYDVPNLGISNSVKVIRFKLKNNSKTDSLLIHQKLPYAKRTSLYQVVNDSLVLINSFNIRELKPKDKRDPFNIFRVNLATGSETTFYLLIQSGERLLVPIDVSSHAYFASPLYKYRYVWYGFFMSVMIVMMLYNIFVYISIRNRIYLMYVIYIICVALTQTSMLGIYQQFFPIFGQNFNSYAVSVFTSLVGFAAPFFAYHFLKVNTRLPNATRFYLAIYVLYGCSLLASITNNPGISYALLLFNGMFAAILLLVSGILIYINEKERVALIFVISWSSFLVGVMVHVIKDLGFLPFNLFTVYAMPVGTALETVLLSFALADRINTLKKERESSQQRMLEEIRKRNELTVHINRELEAKVLERTEILEVTNRDLHKTLDNLQSTQTQLVEAEKMASLGQLTAGIAHEINNPINFVSSNIAPLKTDLQDLVSILTKYQEFAEGKTDPQLEEIKDLEEEIDVTYCLEEMDQLISGIAEGAKRTSEIVNGLRNFSRTDEDTSKEADINQGLSSTLAILRSEIGDLTLNVDYGDIPLIDCYIGKLNQVFMNVLDNSIDAVKSRWGNNPTGIVTVSSFTEENEVVVQITDNGTGISDENLKNVFNPFFTTKEVGKGTGLGLSISYGIVEKHGGTINASSELNKGTTFEIRLPVA